MTTDDHDHTDPDAAGSDPTGRGSTENDRTDRSRADGEKLAGAATPDDADRDPDLDEFAYEERVADPDDPVAETVTGSGLEPEPSADEHADSPNPDADGVA
ncbi:hypothetical protein ACEXQD_01040 [Herbiconiux sp. P15]|uniref:hypothetical protein n=1 Tax=Herbiconiux liukaitaii TaxID=3342799 RepID=UPI0035B8D11D